MKKLFEFCRKHREGVSYLIFGGIATVLSWVMFWAIDKYTPLDELVNNIIVWVVMVGFQYITNRFFVFLQKWNGLKDFWVMCQKFYVGRVFTLLVEEVLLFFGIKIWSLPSLLVKIVATVVIVILNYVISKVWVFRDGRKRKEKGTCE